MAEITEFKTSVEDEFNKWRAKRGLKPKNKRNKKKIHTVNVTEDAWIGLLFLAKQHGILYYGDPNVSGLFEQIGTYKLLVINNKGESKLPEIGPDGKVTNLV